LYSTDTARVWVTHIWMMNAFIPEGGSWLLLIRKRRRKEARDYEFIASSRIPLTRFLPKIGVRVEQRTLLEILTWASDIDSGLHQNLRST
jgi:hypothetical protein